MVLICSILLFVVTHAPYDERICLYRHYQRQDGDLRIDESKILGHAYSIKRAFAKEDEEEGLE